MAVVRARLGEDRLLDPAERGVVVGRRRHGADERCGEQQRIGLGHGEDRPRAGHEPCREQQRAATAEAVGEDAHQDARAHRAGGGDGEQHADARRRVSVLGQHLRDQDAGAAVAERAQGARDDDEPGVPAQPSGYENGHCSSPSESTARARRRSAGAAVPARSRRRSPCMHREARCCSRRVLTQLQSVVELGVRAVRQRGGIARNDAPGLGVGGFSPSSDESADDRLPLMRRCSRGCVRAGRPLSGEGGQESGENFSDVVGQVTGGAAPRARPSPRRRRRPG